MAHCGFVQTSGSFLKHDARNRDVTTNSSSDFASSNPDRSEWDAPICPY